MFAPVTLLTVVACSTPFVPSPDTGVVGTTTSQTSYEPAPPTDSTPGDEDTSIQTTDSEPLDTGSTTDTEADLPDSLDSTWQIVDQYLTVDDCGMEDWLAGREEGQLVVEGTRTDGMLIDHNRGTEECTIDVHDFSCTSREDQDTSLVQDMGLDALLLLDMVATGTLHDGESMLMSTVIEADCSGGDCWLVELMTGGMPCSATLVVEAAPAE